MADMTLNTANHSVTRRGKQISLTAKEYSLLKFFMLKENKIVNRNDIAVHVWDENFDPFPNVIDVYVRRLRKKIEDGFDQPLIHTRRGEGYILSADKENDNVQ